MKRLLQRAVDAHAEARADAIAIVLGERRVGYGDLATWSSRVAHGLMATGCKRGDRIAFAMPKSVEAVVAILGILKAGCVYVPLDLASPPARLARILASCQPTCVLATAAERRLLAPLALELPEADVIGLGWLDADSEPVPGWRAGPSARDFGSMPAHAPDCRSSPEDAAYILFTSGSTGQPKGVVITHGNVLAFLDWALPWFGIDASDRLSGHAPLHFDLSVFDLFGALAAGAELHLVPAELNLLPYRLAALLRDSALTQWFSVPSALRAMSNAGAVQQHDFPALKRLMWCGEVFPTPPLIHWMERLPHVRFTNLYGPTETTIASSHHTLGRRPPDECGEVPIGRPCGGEELLVLDSEHRPVPAGHVGDLYIGGVGVSPGYWQDPDRTREAFVELQRPDGSLGRFYRTGDLARLGGDGLFYFAGRADTQIKSRGYRIELGEIEAALHTIVGLLEGAVVGIPVEGFEGTAIGCAFVTREKKPAAWSVLRAGLRALLPGYMLPQRWLQLDELPKNGNGKVDRRRLAELFAQTSSAAAPAATRAAAAEGGSADG